MKKNYILFLLLFSLQVNAQTSGNDLFDNSYLHEIKIYFDEPNFWEILLANYDDGSYSGDYEYLESPSIYIDGNLIESVGVRQKGFSSHFLANDLKKSLKLDFDKFVEDQNYDGLRKININNGVGDPALMRDMLCYDAIRETGAPAPRVAHTTVFINDEYWGLYALVEQIDKPFLANHYTSDNGNLFKNKGWSSLEWLGTNPFGYKNNFELKTNKTEDDWSGFINLHDVINNSSNSEFPAAIQQVFNVPGYLKILALDIMTDNWDSYIEHGRNFYLYEEPNEGKFHWLPWDYNLAMGGDFNTFGSPIVLDPDCPIFSNFSFEESNSTVLFTDESSLLADSWFWDFGDGNTSNEQNPTHTYAVDFIYTVCLTISKEFPDGTCSREYCEDLDLTIDFSDCPSLINGDCPYPSNDPVLAEVMEIGPMCCDFWDYNCQGLYEFISDPGGGFSYNFPLILDNPEKTLVQRLMDVDEFRDLYLSYACEILENNFTSDRLYPIIDTTANLIREAVYSDPNYMFTDNYFDYDVGYGGQAYGATIPQIKIFLENRITDLLADLEDTNYDCTPTFSSISPMDIVINELVADNDSTSGVTDLNGDFDDWIELYNNTNTTINLSGFYLSDNTAIPYKWAFPIGTTIAANEYLIVWADNQGAQEGIHADFQLNKEGEELQLIHEDGTIIDAVVFGEQVTNLGYARNPNGTGDFAIQQSTFNYNNNAVATNEIAANLFNIYPNPAKDLVHLSIGNPGNKEVYEVGLYNNLGQLVLPFQEIEKTESFVSLPVDKVPIGLYQVVIRGDFGTRGSKSVLIVR